MARYKSIDTSPRFLPVDLARQLLPGTFEHALHHLLTRTLDLSHFDARFRNDATGAPAYPPATLLQVVLWWCCCGALRVLARHRQQPGDRACLRGARDVFIALCGDRAPHFTTIAHFVSTLGADIARVFAAVLAICDQQELIGREMFAIDGVKLPSNASKRRSGTRADFEQQATKLEAAATAMLPRCCSAIARRIRRRWSRTSRRSLRSASRAWSGTRRRSGRGSRRIPRIAQGRAERSGRATGPTTRV